MTRVYLDNAATTKPLEEAIKKSEQIHRDCYGNPSSLHGLGIEAELELKTAANQIARLCGCEPTELYFNSGGTEGDNTAVFGAAKTYFRRGKHIITTQAEHPAVSQPLKELATQGFEITALGVDGDGRIDPDALADAVREDTILVSIHHVNNETGVIQDINRAADIVKSRNPRVLFHSDGVQAFGKIPVDLRNIDLYTLSAHKIHAFKGTGALIIKKNVRLKPLILGGGQQLGQRSGTENVAGVAAFAVAAGICCGKMKESAARIGILKQRLADISRELPDVYINGGVCDTSPYILNMSFIGIRAEVLLHALEQEGIYVSTGAACGAKKGKKEVLLSYGLGLERTGSAIRFSLSPYTEAEEIELCIEALKKSVAALRR